MCKYLRASAVRSEQLEPALLSEDSSMVEWCYPVRQLDTVTCSTTLEVKQKKPPQGQGTKAAH